MLLLYKTSRALGPYCSTRMNLLKLKLAEIFLLEEWFAKFCQGSRWLRCFQSFEWPLYLLLLSIHLLPRWDGRGDVAHPLTPPLSSRNIKDTRYMCDIFFLIFYISCDNSWWCTGKTCELFMLFTQRSLWSAAGIALNSVSRSRTRRTVHHCACPLSKV